MAGAGALLTRPGTRGASRGQARQEGGSCAQATAEGADRQRAHLDPKLIKYWGSEARSNVIFEREFWVNAKKLLLMQ